MNNGFDEMPPVKKYDLPENRRVKPNAKRDRKTIWHLSIGKWPTRDEDEPFQRFLRDSSAPASLLASAERNRDDIIPLDLERYQLSLLPPQIPPSCHSQNGILKS
mmetsp:Transcript_25801/g.42976  ORF Transcript_25801/g.42976 Transcript_25801/m.42976 type:complete len:105 (+) Transcript_25801:152-466(+)